MRGDDTAPRGPNQAENRIFSAKRHAVWFETQSVSNRYSVSFSYLHIYRIYYKCDWAVFDTQLPQRWRKFACHPWLHTLEVWVSKKLSSKADSFFALN